jgi:hypothetical protein
MMNVDVNYLAVFLAGVSAMVVGSLWYSPMMFAKPWAKAAGLKMSDMQSANMPLAYGLMFVGALIEAYVLKHILAFAGAADVMSAVTGAFWVWLGFIVPLSLSGVLFEKKEWNWYFITVGYQLVTLLAMAVILVSWM